MSTPAGTLLPKTVFFLCFSKEKRPFALDTIDIFPIFVPYREPRS